ncbi:MAG: FAD-binding oxidoreductase [Deltaproteobacteria bacterium]|nr:FAD-binding oxidoreductase [Deltaproteobacteria bacterium]
MPSAEELLATLRSRLGDDAVSEDTAAFTIGGRAPVCVLFPSSVAQVSEVLGVAEEQRLAVVPVGQGTHLRVGEPPRSYDIALSSCRMARVIAHEAADMTATVEAGLTLAALDAALSPAGQWLPLDPPCRERVTVGGLIAADLNGPLRLSQGKVRDLLIGITVVLADGSVVKGGGRVVKNVAGYDLGKLFTGSLGTLGVIVEATFKIRPRPEHTRVLWIGAPDLKAAGDLAGDLLETDTEPLFVELLDHTAGREAGMSGPGVAVGLGGIVEEVAAQQTLLAQHYAGLYPCAEPEAQRLMHWLRQFPLATDGAAPRDTLSARLSLLPTELATLLPRLVPEAATRGLHAAVVAHAGSGIARLRAQAGDVTAAAQFCEWLRLAGRVRGGWVVFDSLPDALTGRIDRFGEAGPALSLMRGIKQQLDRNGILSPGRYIGGI